MSNWVLGVDIGGTKVAVGLLRGRAHHPVAVRRFPTEKAAMPPEMVDYTTEVAEKLAKEHGPGGLESVAGIGVGAPGLVCAETGVVLRARNLGWRDAPLRKLFADRTGLPVQLENDADCTALGEWLSGEGRGARSLVAITLGTGVGGGIVLDGKIWRGAGGAGEIGRLDVIRRTYEGPFAGRGSLEELASGPAIMDAGLEAMNAGKAQGLAKRIIGSKKPFSAGMVCAAARDGDQDCAFIVRMAAMALGIATKEIIRILAPEAIVLAGGGATSADLYLPEMKRAAEQVSEESGTAQCRILATKRPHAAGVVGAAYALISAGWFKALEAPERIRRRRAMPRRLSAETGAE